MPEHLLPTLSAQLTTLTFGTLLLSAVFCDHLPPGAHTSPMMMLVTSVSSCPGVGGGVNFLRMELIPCIAGAHATNVK